MQSIKDLQSHLGERDWEKYGQVNATYKDGLVLFNYKASAQWENRWNWFERVSRGLILNEQTGEVVARPFDKFFNWGHHTTSSELVEATAKYDGSLAILLRHNGYKIATRGSFDSEQALWATEHLKKYDLSSVKDSLTLLFEIIYPENRIVIDYGDTEELILIGIRDRFTGEDFFFKDVKELGDQLGFRTPECVNWTIEDIVSDTKTTDGEGWVLRFADGERFKIKSPEYVRLHRIISYLSFKHTLEAGPDWNPEVPEPHLGQIKQWQAEIAEVVQTIRGRVESQYVEAPKTTRKEYALWVKENCPKDATYMFMRLDDRDYIPTIYKLAFRDVAGGYHEP